MTTSAVLQDAKLNLTPIFRPSLLYSRALHFGVSYADLTEATDSSRNWQEWSEVLAAKARAHAGAAELATYDGHLRSAAEHWRSATAYYHFAQLRLADSERKRRLQSKMREAFMQSAPLLHPDTRRLEIPFAGRKLPGYLREASSAAPLIILVGGLDSAKEVELMSFGDIFLDRGLSVFFFDGPGQGELYGNLSMKEKFDPAISAVIDFFGHREAGCSTLAIFGVSFGGYLACRAAARDRRLSACVCLGGFFDGGVLQRLPALAQQTLRTAFGLRPGEDTQALASHITLAPLSGLMDRPLLVVHGCDDHLVDEEQIERLERWACGPHRVWRVPGAEHVCTNRFGECLPVIADWMADNVGRVRAPHASFSGAGVDVCPI